jgi:hypothetical protein
VILRLCEAQPTKENIHSKLVLGPRTNIGCHKREINIMQAKGTTCLDAGTKQEVRSYLYPIESLKMLRDVYKKLVADCTSGVDVPTVSGNTKPL